MGGEKIVLLCSARSGQGSPPHGRGKAVPSSMPHTRPGITPAWAGKREYDSDVVAMAKDHPRMGGEKCGQGVVVVGVKGSPPHGRGKATKFIQKSRPFGITPAWAGKRLKRSHRSGIFISGPIPFHSVLHRPAGSGGSRAGRDGSPAGQPQNAGPA